jgi:hypothetical protein
MAETIAIHTHISIIENQNLWGKFRLGLRRSAILLELVASVGRGGRFWLRLWIFWVSLAFCCWSCSICRWLCRISASNLAIERARLIFLGLVEATFFAGGCGSGTHPIPNLDDENNSNAVGNKSRQHKYVDGNFPIDRGGYANVIDTPLLIAQEF